MKWIKESLRKKIGSSQSALISFKYTQGNNQHTIVNGKKISGLEIYCVYFLESWGEMKLIKSMYRSKSEDSSPVILLVNGQEKKRTSSLVPQKQKQRESFQKQDMGQMIIKYLERLRKKSRSQHQTSWKVLVVLAKQFHWSHGRRIYIEVQ